MKKLLTTAVEAALLLTFATTAMAALFDPAAVTLEWQGTAVLALLLLGATRAVANRRLRRAEQAQRTR